MSVFSDSADHIFRVIVAKFGISVFIYFNSFPLGQNGSHFAGNLLRCIFVNEKFLILIKISLKFVPMGLINNNPGLI